MGEKLRHQGSEGRPGLLNSGLAESLSILALMQEHLTDLRMLCVIRALRDEEVNEALRSYMLRDAVQIADERCC